MLAVLNARRGAAAIAAARLDLAEESLSRSLELFEALSGRPEAAQIRGTIARVHLDRAVVSVLDGDEPAEALRSLDDALSASPTPEIVADMADARAELAPLREMPAWQAIVEPTRHGANLNPVDP